MSTNLSKDRTSLCSFTFADGRRCRMPRFSGHPYLCFFHARKETEAAVATRFGHKIGKFFPNPYVSAVGLTRALANVLCVTAQGFIKPKTACALGYISQTLLQAIPLAKEEYIQVFGTNDWRDAIYDSIYPPAPPSPTQQTAASDADPKPDSDEPRPLGFARLDRLGRRKSRRGLERAAHRSPLSALVRRSRAHPAALIHARGIVAK